MKSKISILLSAKLKQSYVREGMQYYLKKIRPFADVEIYESHTEKKFKEMFFEKKADSYVIALDERGKHWTTPTFAEHWQRILSLKKGRVCWVVGGPYGFLDCPKADEMLSLSSFTLNHEMVPLMFMEQLYRIHTWLKGMPYHHE